MHFIGINALKKLFNGFSLEKQAQFLYPRTRLIKDKFSKRFNELNGTDQILEAYNKFFKLIYSI